MAGAPLFASVDQAVIGGVGARGAVDPGSEATVGGIGRTRAEGGHACGESARYIAAGNIGRMMQIGSATAVPVANRVKWSTGTLES